jgi:hypothetical protein
MDTKLIEDFKTELAAHSAALEKAAELCEAQAARIEHLKECLMHQKMRTEGATKQRDHYRRANQELVLKLNNVDHSLNVKLAFALTMLQDVLVNGWTDEKKKRANQAMSDFLSPFRDESPTCSLCDCVMPDAPDRCGMCGCPAEHQSKREAAESADEKSDGQAENS